MSSAVIALRVIGILVVVVVLALLIVRAALSLDKLISDILNMRKK